jgi:hypothetical protein
VICRASLANQCCWSHIQSAFEAYAVTTNHWTLTSAELTWIFEWRSAATGNSDWTTNCIYCHVVVTRHGIWIGHWIYWTLINRSAPNATLTFNWSEHSHAIGSPSSNDGSRSWLCTGPTRYKRNDHLDCSLLGCDTPCSLVDIFRRFGRTRWLSIF